MGVTCPDGYRNAHVMLHSARVVRVRVDRCSTHKGMHARRNARKALQGKLATSMNGE